MALQGSLVSATIGFANGLMVSRPAASWRLLSPLSVRYICGMKQSLPMNGYSIAGLAAGGALLAAVSGLTFALWMEHGAGIFMTMAETGLSWCF